VKKTQTDVHPQKRKEAVHRQLDQGLSVAKA